EPIHARPASAAERAVKWVRRRPALAALTAGVAVAALALAVFLGVVLNQADVIDLANRDRDAALQDRDAAVKARGAAVNEMVQTAHRYEQERLVLDAQGKEAEAKLLTTNAWLKQLGAQAEQTAKDYRRKQYQQNIRLAWSAWQNRELGTLRQLLAE